MNPPHRQIAKVFRRMSVPHGGAITEMNRGIRFLRVTEDP
jgi:hypothetical protein